MGIFKPSDERTMKRAAKDLGHRRPDRALDEIQNRASQLRAEGNHLDAGLLQLDFAWLCNRHVVWPLAVSVAQAARNDLFTAWSKKNAGYPPDLCPLNIALTYSAEGGGHHGAEECPARGMRCFSRASKMFRAWGEEEEALRADVMWAACARLYGEQIGNKRLLEKSVESLRTTYERFIAKDDPRSAVRCYLSMAMALFALGRPQEVIDGYERARQLCQRGGDPGQYRELAEMHTIVTTIGIDQV